LIETQLEIIVQERKAERIGRAVGNTRRLKPDPPQIRRGHPDRSISSGGHTLECWSIGTDSLLQYRLARENQEQKENFSGRDAGRTMAPQKMSAGDLPDGLSWNSRVQPSFKKFLPLRPGRNIFRTPRRPTPQRGVSRSSRTRGGMRWTQRRQARDVIAERSQGERTNGALRTAKPCGPGAPMLASSLRGDPRATVARKPVTGESTK
jgi:hypothetical protein